VSRWFPMCVRQPRQWALRLETLPYHPIETDLVSAGLEMT
jgi:hypothetical protein